MDSNYIMPKDQPAKWAIYRSQRLWVGDGVDVVQALYVYSNTPLAIFAYYVYTPDWRRRGQLPNFDMDGRHAGNLYPVDSPFQSPTADQEKFVCGMGNPDDCLVWFYRARYDNYIMTVSFSTTNQGMSSELFAKIVEVMDAHLQEHFPVRLF